MTEKKERICTAIAIEPELLQFAEEYGKEHDWSRNKAIVNIVRDKKRELDKLKEQAQKQEV